MPSDHDVAHAVETFVARVNAGQLDAAMEQYDPDAVFAAEPGTLMQGTSAIRDAVAQLIASGASIETRDRTVLRSRDVALYHSSWVLNIGGKAVEEAQSSDVLRLGPDGKWRIAIDNPWGAAHLFAACRNGQDTASAGD